MLYFIFGVHNHQPIGNFHEVFEQAYNLAYKPFIELMLKHRKIKFNLHCSGILWEYFKDKHKEYIDIVKEMIGRNQVELLTGGYYEPILSVIPDRDKAGQIEKLTSYLKQEFNFEPSGMWLAERVWEGHLPKILSEAAVEYTVLDDYHFIASGIPEENLTGYYITEEQGYNLKIFPINQNLRYYIPWKSVQDTIKYLESRRTDREAICLTMADDGEKYGLWPQTYKLVYEENWLDKFFTALEENDTWITTLTFSEALKLLEPKGRVYLPQASYFEMTEWALPANEQEDLQDVVKEIDNLPVKEKITKFIRGSHWRNFLVKYHESNNMYKKMLYVSKKVESLEFRVESKRTKSKAISYHLSTINSARNALYAAQCNCAYWHGVFGGLYLPHLRSAIYKNLIEAEVNIDKIQKKSVKISVFDFDSDGKNEIIFESLSQNLYFQPHCGATLFEWDIKRKSSGGICGINLQNVLTRRKEAYHRKLKEMIESKRNTALGEGAAGVGESAVKSIKTVAEIVGIKEENLDAYLHYDWYKRYSFIDHFIHPETKYDDFVRCKYGEQGDFVLGEYNFKYENNKITFWREGIVWVGDKAIKVKLEKAIIIENIGLKVKYSITNLSDMDAIVFFAPEFNLAFSCKTPEDTSNIKSNLWVRTDELQNIKLKITFSDPTPNLWSFPIETVSISEAGFEKTYQGTSLTAIWETQLSFNRRIEYSVDIKI